MTWINARPDYAGKHRGMIWPYHPQLLERAVPRYTSYPTAAEFHDGVGDAAQGAALDEIGTDTAISLYLHIPFCREICWYCGCNTGAANRSARLTAYLDRLHEEIALVAARLNGRGRVGRIAFGGGSPNAIAPTQFRDLLAAAQQHFDARDAVLSVEVDPRGFDADWAAALGAAGVGRVSLGVQTFAPHIQAAIGRVQSAEVIANVVGLLRAQGVGSINFDLMYGLPGQSAHDLAATLETALTMQPQRLAVFGYAHVPKLIARQRRIDASALPGVEARFDMAGQAHARLTSAGYVPVGFDHYARPDDAIGKAALNGSLRRNFQGFTEDPATVLIGLGASAISEFADLYVQNDHNWGRWGMRVAAGRLAGARGVARTVDDRRHGAVITALLTSGVADLAPIGGAARWRAALTVYAAHDLLGWRGDRLVLVPEAQPYVRGIVSVFDRYRQQDPGRFSTAI